MTHEKYKDVVERFREKFAYNYDTLHEPPCNVWDFSGVPDYEAVESFLLQELQALEESVKERVRRETETLKEQIANSYGQDANERAAKCLVLGKVLALPSLSTKKEI